MNCVQWFWEAYPDVLAFHVPNGELRHPRVAEKLQRMGVLPGVWDWLIFTADFKAIIEFKRTDGVLSEEQGIFAEIWERIGGRVCGVVKTLEEFQATCINLLGAPARTAQEESEVRTANIALNVANAPLKMPWET